jgi:hypothetical protein
MAYLPKIDFSESKLDANLGKYFPRFMGKTEVSTKDLTRPGADLLPQIKQIEGVFQSWHRMSNMSPTTSPEFQEFIQDIPIAKRCCEAQIAFLIASGESLHASDFFKI